MSLHVTDALKSRRKNNTSIQHVTISRLYIKTGSSKLIITPTTGRIEGVFETGKTCRRQIVSDRALWRGNPPIVKLTYQSAFPSATSKPCMHPAGGIKRFCDHWLVICCQSDLAMPRGSILAEKPCCGSNMQDFLENFLTSCFGW